MTDTTETQHLDHPADYESADHHEHPSDGRYAMVALALAIMTGIEVALSYMGLEGATLLVPLMLVMVLKFITVASWFMHLRFDSTILRNLFYAGLLLAVGVYLIVLFAFGIFGD